MGTREVQGESLVRKVRNSLKVQVAEVSIIFAFKIKKRGRKVARVSIILTIKKEGKVESSLSPSTLFTEHRTSFS